MSLDVYLCVPTPATKIEQDRIFIRRNGRTEEISAEEWNELYPDREPVVVKGYESLTRDVYSSNITHNLGKMASQCDLYMPLWRPEEIGITHARQLIEPLKDGLAVLGEDRERLEEFSPENGWGDYDGFVEFVTEYLRACEQFPDAEVKTWR
jgi:hypothetical protein